MSRKLTALGGDIFAGLFTQGIKQAGYKVLDVLEHGPYGVATARLNHPDINHRIGVHNWKPEDYTGKVDFMYTNPPCAAWSNMRINGNSENWREQTGRLQCVLDLTNAGMIVRPKAWAWESVLGAWRSGREFVLEIAQKWNDRGYSVTILLQNNCYLGCPQFRQRMFVIAHKHPLVWQPFTKMVTLREVLKSIPKRGLPKPPIHPPEMTSLHKVLWERSGNMQGRLLAVYNTLTEKELRGLEGSKPLAVYRRLQLDKPVPVMLEADKRLHPTEMRQMNWHEWLRCVGLPYDWKTSVGGYSAATLELSRAVMPPVGEWLGRSVAAGLSKKPLTKIETRVVNFLDPENPDEELLWSLPLSHANPGRAIEWNPPIPEPKAERAQRPPRVGGNGTPRLGIGHYMRGLIAEGKGTEEIIRLTKEKFPQSKATASDVSWNRRKLKEMDNDKPPF